MSNEGDARQHGRGSKLLSAKAIVASKTVHLASHISIKKHFERSSVLWSVVEYCLFLPQIWQWTKEKVALLIDGFLGHDDTCSDSLGQVVVYKFPPKTSVFQPLDQGVICTLKASYKAKLLASLVDTDPNYDSLQHMSSKLPAGQQV